MNNNTLKSSEEWEFIYRESVNKAPKVPLSEPLVQTREILLKMQVILGQHDKEKDIKKKDSLFMEYTYLKKLYSNLINGGLN